MPFVHEKLEIEQQTCSSTNLWNSILSLCFIICVSRFIFKTSENARLGCNHIDIINFLNFSAQYIQRRRNYKKKNDEKERWSSEHIVLKFPLCMHISLQCTDVQMYRYMYKIDEQKKIRHIVPHIVCSVINFSLKNFEKVDSMFVKGYNVQFPILYVHSKCTQSCINLY